MERRLAAILAADVVGYSRLMGADEAGTLTTMIDVGNGFFGPPRGTQDPAEKVTRNGVVGIESDCLFDL